MSPACAIRSQIADDERRWRSSVVRMKSSGNQFKRRDALPRGGLQHLDAVLVGAGQEKDLVAVEPHEAGDGIGRDHLVGKADMRGAVRVGDGGRQIIGLGSHLRALEPSAPLIPKFASFRGTLSCELRNQRSTSKYMFLVRFWI